MTPSFADRDGFIWQQGELVPWRKAQLHFLSHGLHYGSLVYEGIRIYSGRIFELDRHIQRLYRSAKILGLKPAWPLEQFADACREVTEANRIQNGYLRPAMWRGSEMMQIAAPNVSTQAAIAAWEVPGDFYNQKRMQGSKLLLSQWRRPHPASYPLEAKASALYLVNTMAKHEALDAGADDALLLDWEGNLAEATGANLFLVRGGELFTPAPGNFFAGITRSIIIGAARDMGFKVHETILTPEEIPRFDECFLTGTAAEVSRVRELQGHRFESSAVTDRITRRYLELANP